MKAKNYFDAAKIESLVTGKKLAYSLNEVGELIGVTTQHLRNENKRGKIRFVRSGRRILVTSEELSRYLEQNIVEVEA
jgi:excisionase family DNA binding protein